MSSIMPWDWAMIYISASCSGNFPQLSAVGRVQYQQLKIISALIAKAMVFQWVLYCTLFQAAPADFGKVDTKIRY